MSERKGRLPNPQIHKPNFDIDQAGFAAGMRRAAEIARERFGSCGAEVVQAILAELEGKLMTRYHECGLYCWETYQPIISWFEQWDNLDLDWWTYVVLPHGYCFDTQREGRDERNHYTLGCCHCCSLLRWYPAWVVYRVSDRCDVFPAEIATAIRARATLNAKGGDDVEAKDQKKR